MDTYLRYLCTLLNHWSVQAPGSAAKLRNAFRERPKRMAVAVRAPEAGVVADPVRFLLIRFSGLVGWDACVAALGAV